MPKVTYAPATKAAFIISAAEARKAGRTWNEAFLAAKTAGYKGSVKSIQKLVAPLLDLRKSLPEANGAGLKLADKNVCPTTQNTTVDETQFRNTATDAFVELSNKLPVLRNGTKYTRPISLFDGPFQDSCDGEIVAWARILEKEEALCVMNSNTQYTRGADVIVDNTLNPPGTQLTVILNSSGSGYPVGTTLAVLRRWDGAAYVEVRELAPGQTLLLTNQCSLAAVRAA